MTRCPRAGCAGTIDDDGFCDVCGLEATSFEGRLDDAVTAASTRSGGSVTAWSAPSAATGGSVTMRSGPSSRGMLGVGLVDVPPVPYRDPSTVVLKNPQVPEDQRFCSGCSSPVGRSRDGRSARPEGFCPRCGRRFSFTPLLKPGQVLHEQYKVLGCLAHGGLGWIYLARDLAVSGRWVVLKGLIDAADAEAAAAAIAERNFLAKVEHPNIVKIHNFVQLATGQGRDGVGYIVMEYVGGVSLKDQLKQLRAAQGPRACLPVEQALAHAIEILRPLGYLHASGLVYCDVKPDNVIQTQEQLKLIDLGAVRQLDDLTGAVYGTDEYQAPEVREQGPSPASDLYSVGRTLAVLSFPFDFRKAYASTLPPPSEAPLLAQHESLRRALARACHHDPSRRFSSAAEMAEQLTGVLREVLAARDGHPRPSASVFFGPELDTFGTRPRDHGDVLEPVDGVTVARALPVPRVDSADRAAGLLATLATAGPADLLDALAETKSTVEVRLRRVRAYLALDQAKVAYDEACAMPEQAWRSHWAKGLAALAIEDLAQARLAFDMVVGSLPGELAPKLALAAAAELGGDLAEAERYYEIVWRTDRSFVSAAFGLARVKLAYDDRVDCAAVLGSVPPTSAYYVAAQQAAVRVSVAGPVKPSADDLAAAGERLRTLEVDGERRERLESELLEAALATAANGGADDRVSVLGYPLQEEHVRRGLEERYRAMARHARSERARFALIDHANRVRPWTWV